MCLCVFFSSGELMMSLFWYYRPEHTQGRHNLSIHCEVRNTLCEQLYHIRDCQKETNYNFLILLISIVWCSQA